MPQITLNQVHVTVSDINRAISFYRDVVGLDLMFQVPEGSMAFFDLGGTRLYLGQAESPAFASAPLLYFQVANIDEHYNRMGSAGVEFESAPHLVHQDDRHQLWMAFFNTPDGHMNALTEERPLI